MWTFCMHNYLDLFVFNYGGKSQHLEYAYAVVAMPVREHDLLYIQNIIPKFFNIEKNSVVISWIHQGEVIACKQIHIAGMMISDKKTALCKDRMRYFQNLTNR